MKKLSIHVTTANIYETAKKEELMKHVRMIFAYEACENDLRINLVFM